jgi:hypothetical protein
MHYALWGLAYLAVSFVTSVGVGNLLARNSAALPEMVPVPVRPRH